MKIKLLSLLVLFAVQQINATEVAPQATIPAITFTAYLHTPLFNLKGHTSLIFSVAFSPDGKYIATASADGTAKIWDAQTGALIITLAREGNTESVYSAAFSPDSTKVVTAEWDDTAKIWDITQTLIKYEKIKREAATSKGSTTKTWVAVTGNPLYILQHKGSVNSAQFSPDGTKVVTASWDNTAKIWNAQTGALIITLEGHTALLDIAIFSPDGTKIVTVSRDKTAKIWDVATWQLQYTLEGHTDWVNSGSFSPDSSKLVTASNDKTAMIWDVTTGEHLNILKGHTDSVNSALFSPDGKYIATASVDGTAKIWDVATYALVCTFKGHKDHVSFAHFSPDGKYIVTASNDGTAKIWDAATGTLIWTLKGHTNRVIEALFSPDGTKVMTASWDNTAKVWDVTQALFQHEKIKTLKTIDNLQKIFEGIRYLIHKKLAILSNLFADESVSPELKKKLMEIGKRLNGLNINGAKNARGNAINKELEAHLEKTNNAQQLAVIKKRINTLDQELQRIQTRLEAINQESQAIEETIPEDVRQRAAKAYGQRT